MDKTQKTENGEKGEAMLTAFGVIKKTGSYFSFITTNLHSTPRD